MLWNKVTEKSIFHCSFDFEKYILQTNFKTSRTNGDGTMVLQPLSMSSNLCYIFVLSKIHSYKKHSVPAHHAYF